MLRCLRNTQRLLLKPRWLISSAFLAACCVAATVTLCLGVPVARVHDEFAYLLGSDTYASGRLVNPAHPHWKHFETFHVLSYPAYLPKYPVAQSMMMALGQSLIHPHLGVCLSTGLAAASLAWMLMSWLPRRLDWMVWLVAVLHPGLQIKWGHSYMGGALAMMGACLLLGALGYSRRRLSAVQSVLAALGILILANSRPFEGTVLTFCVGLSLTVLIMRSDRWNWSQLINGLILPSGLVLVVGAVAMMYNNYRVTGNVAQLPYQVYESQYALTPIFVWQKQRVQPPTYNHPDMERHYQREDAEAQERFDGPAKFFMAKANSLVELIHFFGGGTQYVSLLGLPLVLRRSRYRLVACILIPVLLAAVATPWTLTHYAAPAAPLILLIILAGFSELSRLLNRTFSSPMNQVRSPEKLIAAITDCKARATASPSQTILFAIFFGLMLFHGLTILRLDLFTNKIPWAHRRQELLQQIGQQPGNHLIFVRYSSKHNQHEEWVYNVADIDRAKVVWARQISPQADAKLIEYFRDRTVHVIDVTEDSEGL